MLKQPVCWKSLLLLQTPTLHFDFWNLCWETYVCSYVWVGLGFSLCWLSECLKIKTFQRTKTILIRCLLICEFRTLYTNHPYIYNVYLALDPSVICDTLPQRTVPQICYSLKQPEFKVYRTDFFQQKHEHKLNKAGDHEACLKIPCSQKQMTSQ